MHSDSLLAMIVNLIR